MVLNPGVETAHLEFTLYWSDREPIKGVRAEVPGERVLGFRLEGLRGPNGPVTIPPRVQYAVRVESSQNVVATYGRVECPEGGGVSVVGYAGYAS